MQWTLCLIEQEGDPIPNKAVACKDMGNSMQRLTLKSRHLELYMYRLTNT